MSCDVTERYSRGQRIKRERLGTRLMADDYASLIFEAIETIIWKLPIVSVVLIVTNFFETTGRSERSGRSYGNKALANKQLCTCSTPFRSFLCIVLHDYNVKLPNYTFNGGNVVSVPFRCFSLNDIMLVSVRSDNLGLWLT